MKRILTLLVGVALLPALHAQTWNGSTSNDWFTAANWTPNTIPGAASNVTIPGGLTNYPLLTSDVSINAFTMQSNSQLHLAGHEVNGTGNLNLQATLIDGGGALIFANIASADVENNTITAALEITNISNSTSFYNNDITGNVVLGTAASNGSNANYVHANTIIGNFSLIHAGAASLYEAYNAGPDSVSGNMIVTIPGAGFCYIGYSNALKVGGDFTLTRTANGTTYVFASANPHSVGGNFSCSTTGGVTIVGNLTTTIPVGGT